MKKVFEDWSNLRAALLANPSIQTVIREEKLLSILFIIDNVVSDTYLRYTL